MAKLTKSEVDNLKPSAKDHFAWADDPKGFGVKVFTSGVKSFVFQYRTKEGKTRRYTIGKLSDTLTVEQARKVAKDLFRDVLSGLDPMGHKQARREALTVSQLCQRYLESPTFSEKAKSTQDVDRGRIDRHVLPLVGNEFADMLTADQVKRMKADITNGKTAGNFKTKARGLAKVKGGAGTANKAVLVLRATYTWAISENLLSSNPAASVEVEQSGQRETILEDSQAYASLFSTLDRMENELRIRRPVADALRLIALTGMRRGEVIGLKWQHVDLQRGQIKFPPREHKTGKRTGKPKVVLLPPQGVQILQRQPDGKAEEYVFRSTKEGAQITLTRDWHKVRAEAKLPEKMVLHELRHSIGSHLAMSGASAVEVMQALGHKQISTTQRYIHFAEQARSTLAQRAAAMATAGMAEAEGKEKAEVVPMPGKRKKSTTAA